MWCNHLFERTGKFIDDVEYSVTAINARDEEGLTPLHFAARFKREGKKPKFDDDDEEVCVNRFFVKYFQIYFNTLFHGKKLSY